MCVALPLLSASNGDYYRGIEMVKMQKTDNGMP